MSLDKVTIFQSAPPEAQRTLRERGRERTFHAGEELMRQGDAAESMYVIVSGRVRVERAASTGGPSLVLAELGPNEVVGEIGVLDGGARTATVTALTETRALELHRTLLAVVIVQFPDVAAELLRTLSRRLRSADDVIDAISVERHDERDQRSSD